MITLFLYISSGTADIHTIDQRIGNSNVPGVWHFRLENNPILDLPSKKCNDWVRQQRTVTIPPLTECPCQFNQAVLDKRYLIDYDRKLVERSNTTICAYSIPVAGSRWVQLCCYTSGGVLSVGPKEGGGPFLLPSSFVPGISDAEGHKYCCNSSQCGSYYQHRPSDVCSDYVLRRRGKNFSLSYG